MNRDQNQWDFSYAVGKALVGLGVCSFLVLAGVLNLLIAEYVRGILAMAFAIGLLSIMLFHFLGIGMGDTLMNHFMGEGRTHLRVLKRILAILTICITCWSILILILDWSLIGLPMSISAAGVVCTFKLEWLKT